MGSSSSSSRRGLRRAAAAASSAAVLILLASWGLVAAGNDLSTLDPTDVSTATIGELGTESEDGWGSLADDLVAYDVESHHAASLEGEDDPSEGDDPNKASYSPVRGAHQQNKRRSITQQLRLTAGLLVALAFKEYVAAPRLQLGLPVCSQTVAARAAAAAAAAAAQGLVGLLVKPAAAAAASAAAKAADTTAARAPAEALTAARATAAA
ncbi:hypothetical protein Emag_007241 [Eimeria magna]